MLSYSPFIEGGRGLFMERGGHSPFVDGRREGLFVERGGCSPFVEGGREGAVCQKGRPFTIC